MDVSVGIISYNDVANIKNLVRYFLEYRSEIFTVKEVVVVATRECASLIEILKALGQESRKFSYILQDKREGKISAINLFLERPRSSLIVLCSGDVYPAKDALDFLIHPLLDSRVGMSGGRVVPFQTAKTLAARLDMILWELHHGMALRRPKLGEMVVFRNMFKSIPWDITVDEAYVEHMIISKGFSLVYQPSAIIYNYTYVRLKDFFRKRIRINLGHKYLQHEYGYKVSSQCFLNVWPAMAKTFFHADIVDKILLTVLLFVEVYSRWVVSILFLKKYSCLLWPLPDSKVDVNIACEMKYASRK